MPGRSCAIFRFTHSFPRSPQWALAGGARQDQSAFLAVARRLRTFLARLQAASLAFFLIGPIACPAQPATNFESSFVNFETAPVHPLALSPDTETLAACNLADAKLEVFAVRSGRPVLRGSVPVGIDPVSVRFHNAGEAWVVNQISASISIVDLSTLRVTATVDTFDSPADVVFAGSPLRAFVSCPIRNVIQVFDPQTRQVITNIVLEAERPKALAVSPDGRHVYAAIFESGNGTTILGAKFRNLLFFENVVSATNGPYQGQNPAPNQGATFNPPLNPLLPPNVPPPLSGLIVRKSESGHWLDANQRDWTSFVSGTNAPATQRIPGWDLPDRDLAIVDTTDFSIRYATGLMNLCMALDVNPASGRIAVVGTDAINEVRFEPNLNGIFIRVQLALIDPLNLEKTRHDLNPHLDYATPTVSAVERARSVGDPRAVVWTADGSRGYVAGMGSRNVVLVDAEGNRLLSPPLEVGEGPAGLALDEARQRLYVFNRFSSSLSVIDTQAGVVLDAVPFFDPTPVAISAGRRHLYDTRRTSGLGQAACASCHPDARMDRLGWDLGNPGGEMVNAAVNSQGVLITNAYHPMKGVMVTQTLQDIIGHEPFHWRGDRPDIESFNTTFTNLQGAATALTTLELRELRDFLASIRNPPNRYRNLNNSLATQVSLPGQTALGEDVLPAGAALPDGNAITGLAVFNDPANFCITCHTLPTGLGLESALQGGVLSPIPLGTNGGHHFPLAFRLENSLRSKIASFRGLADKIGMNGSAPGSRAGFGFGHDGSVDTLPRFLNGLRIIRDQDVADLIAFLLSVPGSDTGAAGAPLDPSPPAAVGRQLTLHSADRPALWDAMLELARSSTSRVDLIAKGIVDGQARGWFYDRGQQRFQSDRQGENLSAAELLALAGDGRELTFTMVPRGTGVRSGIDRDLDGVWDRDELDAGSNPGERPSPVRTLVAGTNVAAGMDFSLQAQIAPLPAPLTEIFWLKDGQALAAATNLVLAITNAFFDVTGDYSAVVVTPFQSFTSAPIHVVVQPLLVTVTPAQQAVRLGSNAFFAATPAGQGPFQYQWSQDGRELVNARASSLTISNAQLSHEGAYQVVAGNSFGNTTSAPVNLGLLINPAVVIPPLSQRVVADGDVTFSLQISGHPAPFGYLLRRASTVLTNYSSNDRTGFLTLRHLQASNAGTYRIVVTNAANPSPGLSLDPITLTVLEDGDHDGLPDEWENAHGLLANDPTDAALDPDHDGMSNREEYQARTDPQDATSFLKVDKISLGAGSLAAVLQMQALSNQTYTIEYRDALTNSAWLKAADLVAFPTNRTVAITNYLKGAATRYYRLATPRTN